MLVIKSPLAIQAICPFGSYTDILGEKIRTGYRLAAADITGEDLFHMIMQRPDIYIGMEGNGIYHSILMVRNQVQAAAALKLELVNQLINRIMLYQTPHFTYQDEVFVASMLQKLGITDTAGFMREVVRHMDRNRLLTTLTDKYFAHGRELARMVGNTITDHELAENRFRSDRYLHNGIFKRLLTAECNNILYSYRNQVQAASAAPVSVHDVTWIEQADAIQLSQLRENMFGQTNAAFWQAFYACEAVPLAQDEWTEKKIMQRMAVAVFENILQKIHYERQYSYRDGEAAWQDYTSILYQGAADSADVIERFRYYQDGKMMHVREIEAYGRGMRELLWDELQLTELLVHLDAGTCLDDDSDGLYVDMRNSVVVSMLENQNFQKQLSEKMRIRERGQYREEQKNQYAEDETDYISELRAFQKMYQELRGTGAQQRSDIEEKTDIDIWAVTDITEEAAKKICGQLQTFQDAEALYFMGMEDAGGQGTIIRSVRTQRADVPDGMDEQEILSQGIMPQHVNMPGETARQENRIRFYQDSYLEQFLNRYAEVLGDGGIPLMENERLLERINEHNLSMKQLLDKTLEKSDTNVIIQPADDSARDAGEVRDGSERVSVDIAQARRNALRVLENPYAVLEEIYEHAPAVRKNIPREVERILSIVDEQTRIFYEQLLGYRNNAEIRQPDREDSHHPVTEGYGDVWENSQDSHHLVVEEYGNVWENSQDSRHLVTEEYSNVWNDSQDSHHLVMEEYRDDITRTEPGSDREILAEQKLRMESDSKETKTQMAKRQQELLRIQGSIYTLLRQIEQKETRISRTAADMAVIAGAAGLPDVRTGEDGDVPDSTGTDRLEIWKVREAVRDGTRHDTNSPDILQLHLTHKAGSGLGEEALDEIREAVRNIKLPVKEPGHGGKTSGSHVVDTADTQAWQNKFEDMRRELTAQSEEQLTHLVERSLKTQVRTISDKVYLELERRLRNEQRRRGC